MCILFLPPHTDREEEAFFDISLALSPPTLPNTDKSYPSTRPTITLKKRKGSHALQRMPHATLPCAMTRKDRVPSLLLPVNAREESRKKGDTGVEKKRKSKKRKEEEGKGRKVRKERATVERK